MCTLYNVRSTRAEMAATFNALDDCGYDLEKDYVATGRDGYVVTAQEGNRRLSVMRWGFPPPAGVKAPVVNVRNYSSPFWRSALKNPERRCLVPATEFSEWSAKTEAEKAKLHWFSIPSRPIFSMAGIWRPSETGPVFAFLTCGYDGEPSAHIVGAVHPKACPVILHQEEEETWLKAPVEEALGLACTFPSQLMAIRR